MVDDNNQVLGVGRGRSLMKSWGLGLSLGLLLGIWGCGDPNVPLTRPPENAFRVSSPRPRRVDRPRDLRTRPTPASRSGVSIAQITAEFLDIPWSTEPVSLLRITAEFLQIPLPPPLPTPSPGLEGLAPLNPDDLPTDPEQLEQILEQMEGEISPEQQQQLLEIMRQQGQDLESAPNLNLNQKLPDAP